MNNVQKKLIKDALNRSYLMDKKQREFIRVLNDKSPREVLSASQNSKLNEISSHLNEL